MLHIRAGHILRCGLLFMLVIALILASPVYAVSQGIEDDYPAPKSAEKIVYGYSGEGRELRAYRFGDGENVMVLSFAIHGYEDHFDRDGECLVYAAKQVMDLLANQSGQILLHDWTVYVLPCVNPDGLNSGYTRNGPGRCTTTYFDANGALSRAHGVDMNRSFPSYWTQNAENRNYTGGTPLACMESKALADFIQKVKGDGLNLLIDVHGWYQQIITYQGRNELLAETLLNYFPQSTYTLPSPLSNAAGYFSLYAHELGYQACLFEFPQDVYSLKGFQNSGYAEKFLSAVSALIGSTESVCEKGTHKFEVTEIVPAKCLDDGYKMVKCALCGAVEKVVIPALGHLCDETEMTVTKAPTATHEGAASYICQRCGTAELAKILPCVFQDTSPLAYYSDALDYCYGRKIIQGIEPDLFGPNTKLSRAMLVTLLHRCQGTPKAKTAAEFPDLEVGKYYYDAICWARENGIVTGYEDGLFRPDATVTRQETAAILYRYAALVLTDVGESGDLSDFQDAGRVRPYAQEAVGWCLKNGIMNGMTENTLEPELSATRAQAVTLIYRMLTHLQNIAAPGK